MILVLAKIQLSEEPFQYAWVIALCLSIVACERAGRGQWNRIAWAGLLLAVLAPVIGYQRVENEFMRLVWTRDLSVEAWHDFLQIFLPLIIAMAAVWRYVRNRNKPFVEPSPLVLKLRRIYWLGFWLNVLLWYGVGVYANIVAGTQSPSDIPSEHWNSIGQIVIRNTIIVAAGCSIGLIGWTLFARHLLKEIERSGSANSVS